MSDKPTNNNEQQIEVTAGDTTLYFTVNRHVFNKYVNEMTMTDKIAPSHNFLARSVDEESKTDLLEFIANTPGGEVDLAGAVMEIYKPDTQIVAKKRSSVASK